MSTENAADGRAAPEKTPGVDGIAADGILNEPYISPYAGIATCLEQMTRRRPPHWLALAQITANFEELRNEENAVHKRLHERRRTVAGCILSAARERVSRWLNAASLAVIQREFYTEAEVARLLKRPIGPAWIVLSTSKQRMWVVGDQIVLDDRRHELPQVVDLPEPWRTGA